MKPKSGVFCFLITEARETTALEMPDRENTFVLKAENNMEYVIEAMDTQDMKSWLSIIKYSMRNVTDGSTERPSSCTQAQNTSLISGSQVENGSSEVRDVPPSSTTVPSPGGTVSLANPPQLPPRLLPSHGTPENPIRSSSSNSKSMEPHSNQNAWYTSCV